MTRTPQRLALWLTLAIGSALACSATAQQPQSASRPDVTGLARGAQVTVHGRAYVLLPEVRAVRGRRTGESATQALARLNLAGRTMVEEKGPFVLYREAVVAEGATLPTPAANSPSLPVLLNATLGSLAIVSGAVRVQLRDPAETAAIASAHQLNVTHRLDHLRVAYFRPAAGRDLLALLESLRADAQVQAADLELLEFIAEPQ
jgi:hypothetical protein